jgi:hypothetical protein
MIGSLFRKILGINQKQTNSEKAIEAKVNGVKKFANHIANLGNSALGKISDEYHLVVSKCKNLLETNYKLGMKHLEAGNLSDAIFRFRFIKKFWPEFYEGQYRLAYCLMLKEKEFEAKQILVELLERDPGNLDAEALLSKMKAGIDITKNSESSSKTT